MSGALTAPAQRAAAALPAHVERWPVTDRASWLAMRQADVTASAIGALLGEHDYVTPLSLYALKTGVAAELEAEPVVTETSISLPPVMRGNEFEPVALRLAGRVRPTWQIEPCGWYYRDPKARIGATPDAIAVDPDREGLGIIQIKSVERSVFREKWRDPETKEIAPPLYIAVQAVTEAHLAGASWACVAVMVASFSIDLHIIEIPIHDLIMQRAKAEVAAFWRGVEAGLPPDPDLGRDGALLEQLWRGTGPEVDLTGDNEILDHVDERERLASAKTGIEKRQKELKTLLMAKLKDAALARLPDGRLITAKKIVKQSYSVKGSEYVDIRIKRSAA